MIESAEEFVRLRCSEDPEEYRRAAHEEAPLEVWQEVIDRYPDMRFWVAHNKKVPLEILRILAHDPDERVRMMVSSKRKLDADTLRSLATDENSAVRLSVAGHKNTPRDVVEALLNDPWEEVRIVARERLHELDVGTNAAGEQR